MKNLKGVFNMFYYAKVLDQVYAFDSKKARNYYVLLHEHLCGCPIYYKDVLKKLGRKLTYCWLDTYATVVKTVD